MKEKKDNKRLASTLTLGVITLNIQNLVLMEHFYYSVIGLDVLAKDSNHVTLGKDKTPLIVLRHMTDLRQSDPSQAGLYHFAILYSTRGDLARTVQRVIKQRPDLFSGSADHLVSEAFYFNDPEGNGIELYFDRDRSQWQWQNNQVIMATEYIDPVAYVSQYSNQENQPIDPTMGHFHLKVGDIEIAQRFYVEVLGFDITAKLPGALFISVGGYHHHFGLNTWESLGTQKRIDSLGLKSVEIFLPERKNMLDLIKRLEENQIDYIDKNGTVTFHDPWNNQIIVKLSVHE